MGSRTNGPEPGSWLLPHGSGVPGLPGPFPTQRLSTKSWQKAGDFRGCWSEVGKCSGVALREEIASALPPPIFFPWSWDYGKNKQK